MGHAIGNIGMCMDDFLHSTPEEIGYIFKAWSDNKESELHDNWERMRLLATIVIQPHCKKRIVSRDLIPLPWDNKPYSKTPSEIENREDAKTRLKDLLYIRDS